MRDDQRYYYRSDRQAEMDFVKKHYGHRISEEHPGWVCCISCSLFIKAVTRPAEALIREMTKT